MFSAQPVLSSGQEVQCQSPVTDMVLNMLREQLCLEVSRVNKCFIRIIFTALPCFLSHLSQALKTICLPETSAIIYMHTYIYTYIYVSTCLYRM